MCVRKRLIVVSASVVVIVAAAVLLWPRSVACRFKLRNATGVKVNVTVYRSQPRTNTQSKALEPSRGWPVQYRFSADEMSGTHRLTVTVRGVGGEILTTREFDGKTVYGKVLMIGPDGIRVSDDPVDLEE